MARRSGNKRAETILVWAYGRSRRKGTEVSPADSVGIDCGLKVDLSRTAVAVQLMVSHQITSNLKLKIRLPQKAKLRNNEVYMLG